MNYLYHLQLGPIYWLFQFILTALSINSRITYTGERSATINSSAFTTDFLFIYLPWSRYENK